MRALAAALLAAATSAAWPTAFVATTAAAAEEDDDNVWSLPSWAQRDKGSSEFGLNGEYAFDPRLSTEFTLTRTRPRLTGAETSLEAEAEVKWLCNNIARDGWGIGVSRASVVARRVTRAGAAAAGRSWCPSAGSSVRAACCT